jgi:hypothetical protein
MKMSDNGGSFLNFSICTAETSPVPTTSVASRGAAPQSKYLLKADQLLALVPNGDRCYATNPITACCRPVGSIDPHEPDSLRDSSWRFFAAPDFRDALENSHDGAFFTVEVLANYDRTVVPMLGELIFALA